MMIISQFDIEFAARMLVCRFIVDKTEPDPLNERAGWWSDQHLTMLDAFVIGQGSNPKAYVEIARQALALYKARGGNSSEIIALLQLAIFRGERLLPITSAREEELLQMAQELRVVIEALPEGTKKMRCQSLFEYHRGVFYNAYGYFSEAAEAQTRSAEAAVRFGDKAGEAVGRFLEAFYRLKHALRFYVKPKDQMSAAYNLLFAALQERYTQLVEALHGSALEDQWVVNGAASMLNACLWLDLVHQDLNDWMATVLARAERLGQAWGPGLQLARAAYLDSDDCAAANAALQAVAGDPEQSNENRATAALVLARRAWHWANDLEENTAHEAVKEYLRQMPEQGTQHVRAIVTRLLTT